MPRPPRQPSPAAPVESPYRSPWVVEFAAALREVRPELGIMFVTTVGLHEWPSRKHDDPGEAAKLWATLDFAR